MGCLDPKLFCRLKFRYAKIGPNEPERIQFGRPVARIDLPRNLILRIHIHADPIDFFRSKPVENLWDERIGDPDPSMFLDDIQPLKFSVATKSSRSVARDIAGEFTT